MRSHSLLPEPPCERRAVAAPRVSTPGALAGTRFSLARQRMLPVLILDCCAACSARIELRAVGSPSQKNADMSYPPPLPPPPPSGRPARAPPAGHSQHGQLHTHNPTARTWGPSGARGLVKQNHGRHTAKSPHCTSRAPLRAQRPLSGTTNDTTPAPVLGADQAPCVHVRGRLGPLWEPFGGLFLHRLFSSPCGGTCWRTSALARAAGPPVTVRNRTCFDTHAAGLTGSAALGLWESQGRMGGCAKLWGHAHGRGGGGVEGGGWGKHITACGSSAVCAQFSISTRFRGQSLCGRWPAGTNEFRGPAGVVCCHPTTGVFLTTAARLT